MSCSEVLSRVKRNLKRETDAQLVIGKRIFYVVCEKGALNSLPNDNSFGLDQTESICRQQIKRC